VIQQNPTGFLLTVCAYLQNPEDFMCSPIVSCLACCHKYSVVCVLTERQVRNKSKFLISPYYIMCLVRKMEVNWKWLRTFNLLIDILIGFLTLNLSSCLFTGAELSICIVWVKERWLTSPILRQMNPPGVQYLTLTVDFGVYSPTLRSLFWFLSPEEIQPT